uniref:Uncharacterized protein n=1 Tax=Amphimedon queenslandica TaxID=400682 RepID=A0A1X7UST9_AMPQE
MAAMFMLLLLVFLPLVHGSSADCSYGQIRLVDGTAPNEGLLEICINNTWGTVCDNLWTDSNAEVVCRQLGYTANGSVSEYFSTGYDQIFLDNVVCGGFESSLLHCKHNIIGTHDCTHDQDIGVICSNCSYGDLRLINGTLPNEGRVEICIDNTWGTVCDRNWTNASADVVCKQLGYNTTGAVYSFFGEGNGDIFVNGVNCIGFENTLLQCEHNLTSLSQGTDCTHQDDVGVICLLSVCYDGQLRLVNGSLPNEGRLEMCYNNTWGTVCTNGWTNIVADFACGLLGYSNTGAVYRLSTTFGQGNGSVFLDYVACGGFERSLLHCVHNLVGDTMYCDHVGDVGIICLDIDQSNNETMCSTKLDNELWDTMSAQGKCEPYIDNPWLSSSVCDSIYTSLHYVYTPNARLLGQPFVRLLMENITTNLTFTPQCYESVVNALCMLYYLPCGYNGTIQVPRFLCSDACTNVSAQMCSDDWNALRSFINDEISADRDLNETIVMPNCSNTDLFIEAFNLDRDCCEPFYQPGPVYNLLASDVTNTSVKLSWSFDPPVTGGVLSYAAVSNRFSNGTQSFTGRNVKEQMIFNLEPFTVYNFSVTLLNTFGNRSSSKVTINTETLPNVPTAPTLISAVSINLTSISVSWRSNIDPLRQSEVELYTVMYYTEGQQNNELNVTAPASVVTINGLAEEKNYSVTVSATNSAGKSASSNLITVQTILIILVFNGVIFVLIIRVSFLHTVDKNKRMKKSSLTKSEVLRMILSYSGILILFGLTWLFAVFTFISEPNVSFIVQFFFAFFNTFQGFFIFFFFVILSSDSRNTWISLLCPRRVRKGKTSLTSTAAKTKSSNVIVTSPVEKKPHKNGNGIFSNGNESMHLEVEKQNGSLIFGNKTILEDEALSADDEFMISEFNSIRFERHLSTRRKHLVEKIEIDFFDGDNASLVSDDDYN